jgi:hypothetical protein
MRSFALEGAWHQMPAMSTLSELRLKLCCECADQAGETSFCSFFRAMPAAAEGTVRLFDRGVSTTTMPRPEIARLISLISSCRTSTLRTAQTLLS